MSLTRLTFDFQDRLSFIGPEEFIQTFAMKDPLENHKVGRRHGQVTTLTAPSCVFDARWQRSR